MPSGRFHDAMTILTAVPLTAAAYSFSQSPAAAAAVGISFLFGGLMFGPDLDTTSVQYSRWWIFRWIWLPYRTVFRHRSRWSHGLVFGSLFRVVYFMGLMTLGAFAAAYLISAVFGGRSPGLFDLAASWSSAGAAVRGSFGAYAAVICFIGLWLGAAAHSLCDMAWTYAKTGRVERFL